MVAGCGAAPPADPHRRSDAEILGSTAGGDAVVGEPRVRFERALQGHAGVLGACRLRVREHRLADFQRFVAIQHHTAAVFRTVTPRKRAGGQPWLTALVWPGSPLPSADVPHNL